MKMKKLQILITQNPTGAKHKGMGIQNWVDPQLHCCGTILQISDQTLWSEVLTNKAVRIQSVYEHIYIVTAWVLQFTENTPGTCC